MHLNGALVPGFLFVSAVLAGYHQEKQQPPFLNRVDRSINSATLFPADDWAGVIWTADSDEAVHVATGTFTVPRIEDDIDSSLMIVMAIGNSACSGFTIYAGVLVRVFPDDIIYWGLAGWGETTMLSSQVIFAEDQIRVEIEMITPTSALFRLIVVNDNNNAWVRVLSGTARDAGCRQDVGWIVAPELHSPLLNFQSVAITDMSVQVSGIEVVPRHSNIALQNIGYSRVETAVMFYRGYAIITYIPPPAED